MITCEISNKAELGLGFSGQEERAGMVFSNPKFGEGSDIISIMGDLESQL